MTFCFYKSGPQTKQLGQPWYRDIQEFIMEFFLEARGPVVQAKQCSGQSLRFVRGMSEETSPSYSLSGIFMRW